MLLKDIVKWYGVISACVFLLISVYMQVAYVYSDMRVDSILGYLKFTAGLSALIFGLLYLLGGRSLRWQSFKDKVKWYGAISACVFLSLSIYIQVTWVFYDVRVGRLLHHLEFTAALAALVFGLLSLPRWQSFFALAVWVYTFYRFTQPAFGGGF